MGRAKQPIALLTAKGNKHLSKAEIEHRKKTEVKADTDNVNPPETLPERLHEKFYYYSEQLVDIGIMTNLDTEALGRYLVAQDNYERVSLQMESLTELADPDVYEEYRKFSTLQERFFKQARALGSDLGLTITGRAKLVVPNGKEEPKELTPEEKLFGKALGG